MNCFVWGHLLMLYHPGLVRSNPCHVLCHAMQVRLLVPGAETVLGDAAADAELFVTDEYEEVRDTHYSHRDWCCAVSN